MTKIHSLARKKSCPKRTLMYFINGKRITRLLMYLFLLDLVFVFLYPFLYMLITSVKSPEDIMDVTVHWLVNGIHGQNYTLSWNVLDYPTRLVRTFMVVTLCTLGHLIACSFLGYGFARYNFRGKKLLFLLLLLSIIVPPQTIITPVYMIFSNAHMTGTYLPLILPTWFGLGLKGGLFIFIFRQFYLSLPRSLEEASSIDGCGPISTFFRIALPSSRSSIMVCLVLSLVWHWNDYFEPTIYITQQKDYLLPMMLPGLYNLMNGAGTVTDVAASVDLNLIYTEAVAMAATTLVIIPVFILYMFLQKQFIEGVERSGITGE